MSNLKLDFSKVNVGDYILVSTLSDDQKEYLNDNLRWSDDDRIGGSNMDNNEFTHIVMNHSKMFKFYMAFRSGRYGAKQVQFNDIVVEK